MPTMVHIKVLVKQLPEIGVPTPKFLGLQEDCLWMVLRTLWCSKRYRPPQDLLNSNLTLLKILKLKPSPQNSISAVFSPNPTPHTSCFDHTSHPDLRQGQLLSTFPSTNCHRPAPLEFHNVQPQNGESELQNLQKFG
ncbi:uncharacterized protein PGTG_16612 [Puccinia graminis f. sp. tritici CRL 75-36-700-3]|uniref:Uncharacterized protein n=1 Tax=Puccinia graminis f. sp. tritici (strain CRL 75-36-700-3 / race SCCL) TaxID=418459 RepID=E3L211_PUCGT|nr:uncharacterized protein PGTG_16612 [Puccinia graminis f. sp. tritici CRL 75-36-700-3]EFP90586.1 hypothetical protein PGTG_16612 [Puccinia graminis f. sp. tritici CRL 75-36-700-3]